MQGGEDEAEEDFDLDRSTAAEVQLPEDRKRNLFLELGGSQFGSNEQEEEQVSVCRGLWENVYDYKDLCERKKEAILKVAAAVLGV